MIVAFIVGIFVVGHIGSLFVSDSAPNKSSPSPPAKPVRETESKPEVAWEIEGVPYAIINDYSDSGIKRSIDVRLEGRVSKEALETIAQKLKKQKSDEFPLTFILYYLPDMEIDAGAWASSHFDAEHQTRPDVRILGTTKERHNYLSEKATESSEHSEHEIIGSWMDTTPFSGGLIRFIKKEDSIYMIKTFQDGSEGRYELVIDKANGDARYRRKGGHPNDYMIITSDGNLAHGDSDGIWNTSRSID